ncbi:UDP-N-acetylmuramoyl-L-alanine--D-glutamate ligase [Sneathia sanguinegens]|uniref:UDP-N-acetylmuramoylalanine--D-glutamate ligase n=1 Tax=Sneathia sanguinegens TaxID=40543 RepID=A0ABT7HIF4_9FUSO|nr:UDP-N-acetylmuramoyl-L-alanine--D-glutamate ligase [Sneathia sanguinegens]MDK9580296.1 UDP-N-acetylmuramoyl-L-alanine--D-glutamate ligase [Sneathia sanguinegens]
MKYIVFGLGISGKGAIQLLEKKKLEYIVVDDKLGISSEEAKKITAKTDIVIKSPGISWKNTYLQYCVENKIKIISEIDLALKYINPNTKIIAVTGTNGKTTVVTKIYELLKYVGYKASLGGNEGHSLAKIVADRKDQDFVVLEMSSYQLENKPTIKPYIALVTNLTPDHLLRYDSVDEYYNTKMNIFSNQDEKDYAIINQEDKEFKRIFKGTRAKIVAMNANKDFLNFDTVLKGKHNIQNMLNIVTVAKILNIDESKIKEFLQKTKPLEHRMEVFFKVKNTSFINDSKGTNVESTLFAIDAYKNKKLYLICGGQDKKIDNSKLFEAIYKYCDFVYLIGENAHLYEEDFKKNSYKNYINLNNLENVVKYIKEKVDLDEEKYILLSPATASFDQYKSFEKRGEHFKELVKKYFGGINE